MPFLHRYLGTPALSFLTARAGGARLKDSQSGFRVFRRDKMLSLDLHSPGMELNSEMLIKVNRRGWRVTEIPAGYRARIGESKLNTFSDGWRNLKRLILLAPDLLLVGPGTILASVGLLMAFLGFITPEGLPIGSLRWQPVFFSSICLVLGVLAVLAGATLAYWSSTGPESMRKRFAFVGYPKFPRLCSRLGALLFLCGLIIDGILLVTWFRGNPAPVLGLAWASLAQSLLILGAALVTFGLIYRIILSSRPQYLSSDVNVGASQPRTNAGS